MSILKSWKSQKQSEEMSVDWKKRLGLWSFVLCRIWTLHMPGIITATPIFCTICEKSETASPKISYRDACIMKLALIRHMNFDIGVYRRYKRAVFQIKIHKSKGKRTRCFGQCLFTI
jgi:hypothetical protein